MKTHPHRNSVVRTTVAFAGLFMVGSAMLLGSIFLITNRSIDAEADAVIMAEEEGLLAQYAQGGTAAVSAELTRRADSWGRNGALYLLTDPGLKPLAGNLGRWPFDGVPDGTWPEFEVMARGPHGEMNHPVRSRLRRLPDGDMLLFGTDLSERKAFAERFLAATFWGIALVALLAAAAGAWLSRRMTRRVAGVAEACQSILSGDLTRRLPVSPAGDEFDMLAVAVNQVLARLEEQTSLLRTTLDSVAHDLRAPMQRLRIRLDDLRRSGEAVGHATAGKALDDSVRDIEHVQRTLGTLLQIARLEGSQDGSWPEPVDLDALANDLTELYEPVANERGISLTRVEAGTASVPGSRQLMAQLLTNLIENAIRHGRAGGHVSIATHRDERGMTLSVSDDGPGIRPEDRDRALQPFVKLQAGEFGEGSGLGLSLVAAIARMHKASLLLSDNEPGLVVTVVFPSGM
jgi:signal transduction histidine kinase